MARPSLGAQRLHLGSPPLVGLVMPVVSITSDCLPGGRMARCDGKGGGGAHDCLRVDIAFLSESDALSICKDLRTSDTRLLLALLIFEGKRSAFRLSLRALMRAIDCDLHIDSARLFVSRERRATSTGSPASFGSMITSLSMPSTISSSPARLTFVSHSLRSISSTHLLFLLRSMFMLLMSRAMAWPRSLAQLRKKLAVPIFPVLSSSSSVNNKSKSP
mmetsp:Transcript_33759/g.101953  ORF Transcript_33759/g.101953 Transcript_33759/m.101953 type:complete len:218 (-) Transcript_33759:1186-1839(-)